MDTPAVGSDILPLVACSALSLNTDLLHVSSHTQCFLKAGLCVVILSVPLPLPPPLPGIPS